MSDKLVLITFLLCYSITGNCQKNGFFGKKNILSISGTGALPLNNMLVAARNSDKQYYKNSKNGLERTSNLIDAGINLSFIHATGKNFGIGIEYGIYFSNSHGPFEADVNGSSDNYINMEIRHEMLDLNTMTFMPKIEFSTNNNDLSVGIHSEIGIGYSITSVRERQYLSEIISYGYNQNPADYNPSKVFNQKEKYHSLTLLYGLSARIPITKNLMIQGGVRYSLNLNSNLLIDDLTPYNSSQKDKGFHASKAEIGNSVAGSRFFSIVTGNIGLAFFF